MVSLDETLDGLISFKKIMDNAAGELQVYKTKLASFHEELGPICKQMEDNQLLVDSEELLLSLERSIVTDMDELNDFLKEKISVLEEYLEL